MRSAFFLAGLLIIIKVQAQNLVPNPGFEDTLGCPYQWDGIQMGYAANWFQPTWGSSDLFTGCYLVPQSFNGYQDAHGGSSYGGFITSCHKPFGCDSTNPNREYLSARLNQTLIQGQLYYCTFHISRADSVQYASKLGVLFSDSLSQASTMPLPYTAQFETTTAHIDKLSWTEINFSFVATGDEDFITIGNFRNDLESDIVYTGDGGDQSNWEYLFAYYYIDDICVSPDSQYCKGGVGLNEYDKLGIELIRITDLFGNTVKETSNTLLLYHYSDGSIQKRIHLE